MKTINYRKLDILPGDKVLDLGCGEGRHAISVYLETGAEVIGVDLSKKDLQTAEQRLNESLAFAGEHGSCRFEQQNALALNFEDNHFDVVICSEVLEHIPDYQGVLKEIDRVLKPNGIMALSVPRAWPEEICWKLSKPYYQVKGGHIRIFNAVQLCSQVEDFGWQRFSRHWAHALHVPYWWLKCAFWEQEDHWAIKQYHRLLVWDLMQRPWLTRALEWLLNPIMGKSIVMYFHRDSRLEKS